MEFWRREWQQGAAAPAKSRTGAARHAPMGHEPYGGPEGVSTSGARRATRRS